MAASPLVRFGPGAFRLTLAALVFVSHVSRVDCGRAAVILFFALSGFWVTRLYELRREPSVWPYLRDRLLRVWPLLAVVAIAIAAGSALSGRTAPGSALSTIALLGLATRRHDIIGVAWSLDIEMQFYLALPFVLAALARVAGNIRPLTATVGAIAATAAGVALLSAGIATVLTYAAAFAAGAAIWRAHWSPRLWLAAASLIAFAAAVAIIVATPSLRWLMLKTDYFPWWFDLTQIALCTLLVPFVAWNVHQPSPPLDRHLGNLSYPFYLVHYPLIAATAGLTASAIINKGLAVALSIAATLILYAIVDRPLERVRKVALVARRRTTTIDPAF